MAAPDEDEEQSCLLYNFLLFTVIIGALCVIGLAGNGTSILVLLKHRTETSAIFLLECMAVSDSLLLVACVFIYTLPAIHPFAGHMLQVHQACDAIQNYVWPLALMAHTTTIWLTVLVSLNRFFAICRPIGSVRMYSVPVVRLQVLAVVVFSVLYNLPRFFEHQEIHRDAAVLDDNGTVLRNATEVNLGDSKLYQIIYSNVIYFPVMYILPLLMLAYLNINLIRGLNAVKAKKASMTGQRPKEDHITVCVVALVCVFILCQTPALINQIFWAALSTEDRACGKFHFYYTKISDVLVVLNSSCNFAIYCLFGKTFRKIFICTLCKNRGTSGGIGAQSTLPTVGGGGGGSGGGAAGVNKGAKRRGKVTADSLRVEEPLLGVGTTSSRNASKQPDVSEITDISTVPPRVSDINGTVPRSPGEPPSENTAFLPQHNNNNNTADAIGRRDEHMASDVTETSDADACAAAVAEAEAETEAEAEVEAETETEAEAGEESLQLVEITPTTCRREDSHTNVTFIRQSSTEQSADV